MESAGASVQKAPGPVMRITPVPDIESTEHGGAGARPRAPGAPGRVWRGPGPHPESVVARRRELGRESGIIRDLIGKTSETDNPRCRAFISRRSDPNVKYARLDTEGAGRARHRERRGFIWRYAINLLKNVRNLDQPLESESSVSNRMIFSRYMFLQYIWTYTNILIILRNYISKFRKIIQWFYRTQAA